MQIKPFRYLVLIPLIVLFSSFSKYDNQQEQGEKIEFKETVHNFGKIKQFKPVFYAFTYTNNSPYPLVIEDVKTSCGCTVPKKPERPTMPGKVDSVTVGYNAATLGKFLKTIRVKVAGDDMLKELVINGEVVR